MKWFSIGGIVSEIRKIEWPTPKQLMKDSMIVFGFVLFLGIFFFLCTGFCSHYISSLCGCFRTFTESRSMISESNR